MIDLLVLLVFAVASSLTALHFITAKQVIEINTPAGPLSHLDEPAPAPTGPTTGFPGDTSVQVSPAK